VRPSGRNCVRTYQVGKSPEGGVIWRIRTMFPDEGPPVISRRDFSKSLLTTAAAAAALTECTNAQHSSAPSPGPTPAAARPSRVSFPPVKQIDAGLLNIGYVEDGSPNGPPIILLHGWPYDINSYVDVVPIPTANGYRVVVPYLRGYGSTRFLSDDTFRNGQQAALASDVIDLMDALTISSAIIGGFDLGGA
jgi:predicted alpha/beta-fold hydrolase